MIHKVARYYVIHSEMLRIRTSISVPRWFPDDNLRTDQLLFFFNFAQSLSTIKYMFRSIVSKITDVVFELCNFEHFAIQIFLFPVGYK